MSDKPTRPTLVSLAKDIEDFRASLKPIERDAEASVIDKCVRAIDVLPKRRDGGSYGYSSSDPTVDRGAVERVLDYLRQRYGLPDPGSEARGLESQLRAERERVQLLEFRLQQITSAVQS